MVLNGCLARSMLSAVLSFRCQFPAESMRLIPLWFYVVKCGSAGALLSVMLQIQTQWMAQNNKHMLAAKFYVMIPQRRMQT